MNKTMNKPCLTLFAALVACLLVTMWASPSTASTPCERLVAAGLQWAYGGHRDDENPIKPVNVGSSVNGVHTRTATISVTWDVPAARPDGTVSGQCVHLRHISTGDEHEHCEKGLNTIVDISGSSCLGSRHGRPHCRYGNYTAKVKMRNNCDVPEHWSDSITLVR